jgi:hypothetical protein
MGQIDAGQVICPALFAESASEAMAKFASGR